MMVDVAVQYIKYLMSLWYETDALRGLRVNIDGPINLEEDFG
jgi:hypothetical protein